MIKQQTLIDAINNEKSVFMVGFEIFATRSAASEKAKQLNRIADALDKPRVTIDCVKAHTLSNAVAHIAI